MAATWLKQIMFSKNWLYTDTHWALKQVLAKTETKQTNKRWKVKVTLDKDKIFRQLYQLDVICGIEYLRHNIDGGSCD